MNLRQKIEAKFPGFNVRAMETLVNPSWMLPGESFRYHRAIVDGVKYVYFEDEPGSIRDMFPEFQEPPEEIQKIFKFFIEEASK